MCKILCTPFVNVFFLIFRLLKEIVTEALRLSTFFMKEF